MTRYQYKPHGDADWRDCSKAYYERYQRNPHMRTRALPCDAVQCSDQMVCGKCDQTWDCNDWVPPQCKKPMSAWHYIGWGVVALAACLVANGGDLLWALFGVAVGGVYLFLKRGKK